MHSQHILHIISFDVPFPPDYGGVIDVFFKIKALHAHGVRVHLHCFEYGRSPKKELEALCESVHYYPRSTSKSLLFDDLPYIVLSRSSAELRQRLLEDAHPILMEGLHSTLLLNDPAFFSRKCIVRAHNVEHDYYENLAKVEKRFFKRFYFKKETNKLRNYESVVKRAHAIAAISPEDTAYFNSKYGNATYIPAFHPFDACQQTEETQDFAFYHGNLAVGENNEAALFLIEKVFDNLPYRLVIAGSRPSEELKKAAAKKDNVQILDCLTPEEIHRHIATAKVNVLPTFQSTGIKLKLLAALFLGQQCLVNSPMVLNTGLEKLCTIANDANGFKQRLKEIFVSDGLKSEQLNARKVILESGFSNTRNAQKLVELIFG